MKHPEARPINLLLTVLELWINSVNQGHNPRSATWAALSEHVTTDDSGDLPLVNKEQDDDDYFYGIAMLITYYLQHDRDIYTQNEVQDVDRYVHQLTQRYEAGSTIAGGLRVVQVAIESWNRRDPKVEEEASQEVPEPTWPSGYSNSWEEYDADTVPP